jgi:hypothetical protein
VNNAIFLCLECSGQHRALGAHISFVKSVKLDAWSQPDLRLIGAGGNREMQMVFDEFGIKNVFPIDFKYKLKGVVWYRAKVNNF